MLKKLIEKEINKYKTIGYMLFCCWETICACAVLRSAIYLTALLTYDVVWSSQRWVSIGSVTDLGLRLKTRTFSEIAKAVDERASSHSLKSFDFVLIAYVLLEPVLDATYK